MVVSAEQLSRYFNNTTSAKFSVLTDGLMYYFFTDLVAVNVMDKTPFHVLDLRKIDSAALEASLPLLERFKKTGFNSQNIRKSIRQAIRIREILEGELKDPTTNGLLRIVADRLGKELFPWQKNPRRLNNIKPVLKQVLAELVKTTLDLESIGLPLDLRDWKTIDNWVAKYIPSLGADSHSPAFLRFHAQELEGITEVRGAKAWGGTDRLALFEIQRNMKRAHLTIALVVGPGDEQTKNRFYGITRKAQYKGFFRRVNRETGYMHIYGKVLFSWAGLDSSNGSQMEAAAAQSFQNWFANDYLRLINAIREEFWLNPAVPA